MSTDLRSQLRDAYLALDDKQAPLTVEEIIHRAGPVRRLPLEESQTVDRNWRIPVLVAAGAAVITFLVLIPVLFLNADRDQAPATTPPTVTPTTLESSPTTENSATMGSPIGYTTGILGRLSVDEPWRVVEWQILSVEVAAAKDKDVQLLAVARIVPLVMILPGDVRIWVSPDGESWSAVVLPDAVVTGNSGPFTGPVKVATGGPGLVAVGVTVYDQDCFRIATNPESPPNNQAYEPAGTPCNGSIPRGSAVWTSRDGLTWTRVDEQPAFDGAYMYSVAAGDGTLVAVGFKHEAGRQDCDCMSGNSVVWTSQDGLAWTRLAHDEAAFGQSVMYDVTYGPNGFVAVGWQTKPDWDDPVFWHSFDGLQWSRVELPDELRTSPGFAGFVDGLYVVETAGLGNPLWWSRDGNTWTTPQPPTRP